MSAEHLVSILSNVTKASREMERLDDYYDGEQPLRFLAPEIEAQLGGRLTELVINWPAIVLDALEERLDVEGFRLARDLPADSDLWDVWQANDLDEWSQQSHLDAMLHREAFVSVWASDDLDVGVRVAPESALQMGVEYVPGSTRELAAAAKSWDEGDTTYAELYLPDRFERFARPRRPAATSTLILPGNLWSEWRADGVTPNPLGEVPVVPLVNRQRLSRLHGMSELTGRVLSLADAVNKLATDMMVTSEFAVQPRRYATGLEVAKDSDPAKQARLYELARQQWDAATKGRTWLAPPGVQFGQFPEATLDGFTSAIKLLVQFIGAMGALPPHYLGIIGDNPASADAIRSAEAALVKRVERKQRAFGGAWERAMRLALKVRDTDVDASARSMETIWRRAATPTPAQDADRVSKLLPGQEIITRHQAREDLGYSPTQIARMREDEAAATQNTATADVEARVQQARRLMAEDGLSLNAAYAAVGLMAAASVMQGDPPAAPVGPQ